MLTAVRNRSARAQGFTLLEILIVVMIIGVMTTVFLVTLESDRHDQVNTEAQRFAALLRLASQESLLGSKDMTVEIFSDGYRFLVSDQDQWQVLNDRLLAPRQLPEGLAFAIQLEGIAAQINDATTDVVPRIYLYPTGEMTPFTVTVTAQDSDVRYHVSSGLNGKLEYAEQ